MCEQPSATAQTSSDNLTITTTHWMPYLQSQECWQQHLLCPRLQYFDKQSIGLVLCSSNLLWLPWFQISHWPPQSRTSPRCTHVPENLVSPPPGKSWPASGFSGLGLHPCSCKILEAKTWAWGSREESSLKISSWQGAEIMLTVTGMGWRHTYSRYGTLVRSRQPAAPL